MRLREATSKVSFLNVNSRIKHTAAGLTARCDRHIISVKGNGDVDSPTAIRNGNSGGIVRMFNNCRDSDKSESEEADRPKGLSLLGKIWLCNEGSWLRK
jgi:hypothetical protein